MTRARDRASADFNGQEIIIDADADTSITADTDDTIHFKIGGNDRGELKKHFSLCFNNFPRCWVLH